MDPAILVQILKRLADPLVFLLLLMGLGILAGLVSGRRGRGLVLLAWLGLYALSTPFVGLTLRLTLEQPYEDPEAAARALGPGAGPGAIVVLSANQYAAAPEYGGDTVGDLTLPRVRYAARLSRRTGLPILVSGGSLVPGTRPIAQSMKAALVEDFNLPVRWVEDRSRTTWENARFSAEILKADGIDTVYLVTHAMHMPRSRLSFEAAGMTVVAAPTLFGARHAPVDGWDFVPHVEGLAQSLYAAHEWIGRVWYRWAHL
ncbi:MAG: YdcF family protein [Rhodobacterales bacterium]|nr:YdcF family protein [Rhodobacterales bacterium]